MTRFCFDSSVVQASSWSEEIHVRQTILVGKKNGKKGQAQERQSAESYTLEGSQDAYAYPNILFEKIV